MVQTLTVAEHSASCAAIRVCVNSAIDDGTLRRDINPAGLATLFEGLLVGLSIQARDGLSTENLNAAISQALNAWDANRNGAC